MSRPRVVFACRGSVDDGLGHLIRSAVVAGAAARDLDATLVAVGDDSAARVLDAYSLESRIVAGDAELAGAVETIAPDGVVWDMIRIDDDLFARISHDRLSVSLSPIFSALDQVDLAFSRTRYGPAGAVADDPSRGRYGGPEYAVVRPECVRIDTGTFARNLDEHDLSIAISMGGADAANLTLSLLSALRELAAPAVFWTILGEGYGHSYRELVDCVRRDTKHEIILAKTNRSMWRTLGNCSLAILAGGVTAYEAAHAGLPSLNVLASPEDAFLTTDLIEKGVAFDGGLQGGGLDRLVETASELAADRERLLAAHRASRSVVDGRGAERIVSVVAERLGVASPLAMA